MNDTSLAKQPEMLQFVNKLYVYILTVKQTMKDGAAYGTLKFVSSRLETLGVGVLNGILLYLLM